MDWIDTSDLYCCALGVFLLLLIYSNVQSICVCVQDLSSSGSHLASTYGGLAILKLVGDDLEIIDTEAMLITMKHLQQPDGRYTIICFVD